MVVENELQYFLDDLKKDKIVQKNLYDTPWAAGSVTVYPISVYKEEVTLQWKSDKSIFDKFIEKMVKKYSNLLKCGYFLKSDGSCPSIIIFKLKKHRRYNL